MPALDQIEEVIQKTGWAIVSTATEFKIPYTYTIGFKELHDRPDIIVIGVKTDISKALLDVIKSIYEDGVSLDFVSDKIIEDFNVKFVKVDERYVKQYMIQAVNHYETDFEALQLVWPDFNGLFPNDVGYNGDSMQFILQD
jgi:hypothetical protein